MFNFDFTTHPAVSNRLFHSVEDAVQSANEKARSGNFKVCRTLSREILVLTDFSVLMRDDVAEILYDTDKGYLNRTFTQEEGS